MVGRSLSNWGTPDAPDVVDLPHSYRARTVLFLTAVLAFEASAGTHYAALMSCRLLLRVFVALTTFVVVWVVAPSAARAAQTGSVNAAPVCDPRGAIMFAPPPQMQDPEQSLDIVVNDDDCTQSPLETRHIVPNRAPVSIDMGPAQDPATANVALSVAEPEGELCPAPVASLSFARPGFRSDVERPPRA